MGQAERRNGEKGDWETEQTSPTDRNSLLATSPPDMKLLCADYKLEGHFWKRTLTLTPPWALWLPFCMPLVNPLPRTLTKPRDELAINHRASFPSLEP